MFSGLTLSATWKPAEKFGAAWSQADILGPGAVLERVWAVIHTGWWVKSAISHRRAPDGYEFEQALEVGDDRGSLACCSPQGCKELYMNEQLN